MNQSAAWLESEAIEIKFYNKDGTQFIYRLGEPGEKGKTLRAQLGINVELEEIYSSNFGLSPRYTQPISREFNLKVVY